MRTRKLKTARLEENSESSVLVKNIFLEDSTPSASGLKTF